jgi:hypothetical protein
MSPKTLGAFTDITRLMMMQSSLDIEALIRNDLSVGLALAIDNGALQVPAPRVSPLASRTPRASMLRPRSLLPTRPSPKSSQWKRQLPRTTLSWATWPTSCPPPCMAR